MKNLESTTLSQSNSCFPFLESKQLSAPTHRLPSTCHSFRGNIRTQEIFAESVESHRKRKDKHRVLFPGTDRYEMVRMDIWNHDEICTPCLILQPKTASEVSSCVLAYDTGVRRCLKENRQECVERELPRLCIAGGRNSIHCIKAGSIVIDLSRMRKVTVDADKSTCTVQGGARVSDLDSALAEHGLIAISGMNKHLGVAGCILGGGFGYATRKYGFACDNVLDVDVVLADGRLKRCSSDKNEDIFWSLMGGGGGIGVIVSMTLRCYPLEIVGLVTLDLLTSNLQQRQSTLQHWANWLHGNEDDESNKSVVNSDIFKGTTSDIYSHLILPTDSSIIKFLGTSIDTESIPQSIDLLEQFQEFSLKKKKRISFLKQNHNDKAPFSIDSIPGLSELSHSSFGATRSNFQFQLARYHDDLQNEVDQYFEAGNFFISYKYAKSLTSQIINILSEATIGAISPNNESRIFLYSIGGHENKEEGADCLAFDSREANYVIFIEGKWSSNSEARESKERKKVSTWVHNVVNQLNLCDGVQSTSHPESVRDQISKSGKSQPPSGYYNFSQQNGERLVRIKKKRDSKNIFSLSSRVSFIRSAIQ